MRIACMADLHARGRDLDAFEAQLKAAVKAAAGCDFILVAGDVFDRPNVADGGRSTGDIIDALWPLRTSGIDTIIVPGNHDKDNDAQLDALGAIETPNLAVVRKTTTLFIPEGKATIRLTCVPWQYKTSAADEVAFSISRSGEVHILLGHLQVRGARLNRTRVCETGSFSVSPKQLEGFDYLVLGDFHMRQEVLPGRGGYVGALRQLNYGERGNPAGIEILTVDGKDITSEWVELHEAPRYEVLEWHKGQPRPTPTPGRRTRILTPGWTPGHNERDGIEAEFAVRAERSEARAEIDGSMLRDPHTLLDLYGEAHDDDVHSLHTRLDEIINAIPTNDR